MVSCQDALARKVQISMATGVYSIAIEDTTLLGAHKKERVNQMAPGLEHIYSAKLSSVQLCIRRKMAQCRLPVANRHPSMH